MHDFHNPSTSSNLLLLNYTTRHLLRCLWSLNLLDITIKSAPIWYSIAVGGGSLKLQLAWSVHPARCCFVPLCKYQHLPLVLHQCLEQLTYSSKHVFIIFVYSLYCNKQNSYATRARRSLGYLTCHEKFLVIPVLLYKIQTHSIILLMCEGKKKGEIALAGTPFLVILLVKLTYG